MGIHTSEKAGRARPRPSLPSWRRGSLLDRVRWLFVLMNVLYAAVAPLEATYEGAPSWPANLVMVVAFLGLGVWAIAMQRAGGRGAVLAITPFVLLVAGGIAVGETEAVVGRVVLTMFQHALYQPSRWRLATLGTGYSGVFFVVGGVLGETTNNAVEPLVGVFFMFMMTAVLQEIARTLRQHEVARERDAVLTRTVGALLAERDVRRLDRCVAQGLWELLDDPEGFTGVWAVTGGTLTLTAAVGAAPEGIDRLHVRDLPADLQEAFHRGEPTSLGAKDIARVSDTQGSNHVAAVSVPILTEGRARGVVTVASVRPIDDDLLPVLERFAQEVALAQQLAEREQLLAGVIANSPDLVAVLDAEGQLSFVSPAVHTWTGRRAQDLEGQMLGALLRHHHDDGRVDPAGLSTTTPTLLRLVGETREGGAARDEVEVTANALADGTRVLGIRDVSERRRLEDEITYRAFHDGMTGLPNRVRFLERLQELTDHERDPGAAVVLLDLDDFKAINDTLGHAAGDDLLTQVGQRLQDSIRLGDLAARLGGDEFALLLTEIHGPEHARAIVDRILEAFRTPITLDGRHVRVSASAGIAVLDAGAPSDAVLRNADLAMYAAKALGKDGVALFHPGMHEEVVAFQELRAELETAISEDQLVVHYQPIVELGTGSPVGVEALVRWNHPRLGLVPPDRFIPVAEETGLIVELGRTVLMQACAEVATWAARPDAAPPQLSVNLSPVQLRDPRLIADVAAALERSGLQPAQLTLEITETALMGDTELVSQVLNELRALGLRIAIDDFGTGYSSISHLNAMPVDIIKIDREFVGTISSGAAAPLAEAIIKLAGTLNLHTVAEGVEHAHQQDRLAAWGCTHAQGWLWAPAHSAEMARAFWTGTELPIGT